MAVSPGGLGASAGLLLRQRLHLLSRLELVHAGGGDRLAVLHARGDGGGVVAPACDGDGAQLDGAALPVDHPNGGLRAALEDGRQRHFGHRRRIRPLEAQRRGHAQPDEFGLIDHAEARRIGAGHGIGAGRELAQLGGIVVAGVGPQLEGGGGRLAHQLQPMLGHADQDLELVRARDLHHALALRHDLSDLGLDRRDDARRIGVQLGVGEVVLGRGELALGLLDTGQRGRRQRLALVERLRHEGGAAAQVEVALMVGLGPRIVGLRRGQGGAGDVDGKAVVGGIEPGDQVAWLDGGPDIDGPRDDLAGDAKAQGGLDARHDGARHDQRPLGRAIGDLHHAGGPHNRLVVRDALGVGRHPGQRGKAAGAGRAPGRRRSTGPSGGSRAAAE